MRKRTKGIMSLRFILNLESSLSNEKRGKGFQNWKTTFLCTSRKAFPVEFCPLSNRLDRKV